MKRTGWLVEAWSTIQKLFERHIHIIDLSVDMFVISCMTIESLRVVETSNDIAYLIVIQKFVVYLRCFF